MTEIVKVGSDDSYGAVEKVVINGDLSGLNAEQRVQYYRKVCESLGLNPYTRPFDYITLNGKLTLYAKKDATEQLRKLNRISITALDGRIVEDLYIVTATAQSADGRTDQATGAVSVANLKGEAKANAIMKAETKAKRRVTLSIAGLGWTDETEVDSIPGALPAIVDMQTGEILQRQPERISEIRPAADVEFGMGGTGGEQPTNGDEWEAIPNATESDKQLTERFDELGRGLYGDQWPGVRDHNINRITSNKPSQLSIQHIQTLINGMNELKKKRQPA